MNEGARVAGARVRSTAEFAERAEEAIWRFALGAWRWAGCCIEA